MKIKSENNSGRFHREYSCRNCDICKAIRSGAADSSLGEADATQSIMELLGSGKDRNFNSIGVESAAELAGGPVIVIGEVIPLKFFAAWMVKNIPAGVYQEILSVMCLTCEKSFRDYLLTGKIECQDCEASFSPFIKSVFQLMQKRKAQG